MAELNCFWLKHVFIVKPSHFLTQGRIAIITLSSAPAIRRTPIAEARLRYREDRVKMSEHRISFGS
ncbi:hypothetical protein ACTXT7_015892 [Hymenolepis weldensis]